MICAWNAHALNAHPDAHCRARDLLVFAVILVVVAWLWVKKLFPNLTSRGQLRKVS